jgi:mono/diheme cytochrome c family protein
MRAPVVFLALGLCWLAACERAERDPKQFPISRTELAGSTQPSVADGADAAELTYKRYCIGCHGADGMGNGGTTGAQLAGSDSPLRTRSEAELFESVKNGKAGKVASMPAHKPILSDAQIHAVLAYTKATFAP